MLFGMRPRPRIRKTVKWGGLAVSVFVAVLWVGSRWIDIGWGAASGDWIALRYGPLEGCLEAPAFEKLVTRGWQVGRAREDHFYWKTRVWSAVARRGMCLPRWIL